MSGIVRSGRHGFPRAACVSLRGQWSVDGVALAIGHPRGLKAAARSYEAMGLIVRSASGQRRSYLGVES